MKRNDLSRADALKLLAAGAAVVPLASSPARAETPKRGGTLRVILDHDVIGIDPHGLSAGNDRNVYTSIYNNLVTADARGRIVPDLAQSWSTPNPRTYVFKLRPNVKFHDGTVCDAGAIKKNFDYILNPANGSARRVEIEQIDRVEALDPLTVRFTLKSPFSPFLVIISDRSGAIVSPAAREKYGKELTRNPVGTGPFKFVEWVRDDHLRLRRNENYWDRNLPYLDEIVYRPTPDQSVALTELRAGSADFLYTNAIDFKDVHTLRTVPNLAILEGPGCGFQGILLNPSSGPLANRSLRQAFSHALDRSAIVAVAYAGVGRVANGPIPPSSFAYDPGIHPPQRDPELAKKLIAQAGKTVPVAISLRVTNSLVEQRVAQIVQSQLRESGFDARIVTSDFASMSQAGRRGDFDAMIIGWSGRIDPDGNIQPWFEEAGAFNYGKYRNAEVDRLLLQARETTDEAARKKIYQKLVMVLNEDVPYVFFYFTPALFAAGSYVRGFVPGPDALMRFKTTWLNK